ncbi:efflux RND transporter periplasmic adaptor subunit [candidate division KSB1 bacterium]|nr:efflux RND transporter periplasmic adaptor subunit [candidate division KSB1 bacterium]
MSEKSNNTKWVVIIIFIILGQWAFHRYDVWDTVFSPGGEESSGRTIAYWVAPMDPTYISEQPGKSPMGMDLVPVYEDEINTLNISPDGKEVNPGQITIDPVTVQNMGVRSVIAERRKLSKKIRAVGQVAYDETRIYGVTTKISGWAEKMYVDYVGQSVQKGDPLIDLYSPELVSTQEEYLQALKFKEYFKGDAFSEAAQQAVDILASTKKRLQLWDITDEQIEELERTQEVKKSTTIYTPVSGIVKLKMINEGERVSPNMRLYEIADLSNVWVIVDIYEYEIPWIELDQPVVMTLISFPGRKFSGKITFIYPFMNPKTRTIQVRFEFDNPGMLLKPNMYANVEIESTAKNEETVIPVSAVILTGERNIIIIDMGEGKFEPREVTIGIESDGYYTVLEGLSAGEKVVVSAQFLFDSESRLREAQMKMLAPNYGSIPGSTPDSSKTQIRKKESPEEESQLVTLIGEGEMLYTCLMRDDMVFSANPGICPECGMNLVDMDEDDRKRLDDLLKRYEVKRIKE